MTNQFFSSSNSLPVDAVLQTLPDIGKWAPIPDLYDVAVGVGYVVNTAGYAGRIAMSGQCRILEGVRTDRGYIQVSIKGKLRYLHHLLMLVFVGPKPDGHQVQFIDGDSTNCRLDNLKYSESKDISDDRIKHGTLLFGEDHHRAYLTDDDVILIRQLAYDGNHTMSQIAKIVGTTVSNTYAIVQGRTWKHLKVLGTKSKNKELRKKMHCLRGQYAIEGVTIKQLADQESVSYATMRELLKYASQHIS